MRQLIELGVEAEPGGEREEVSVFFSDIADFTSVSERLTPEELVEFLGEYLSEVTSSCWATRRRWTSTSATR